MGTAGLVSFLFTLAFLIHTPFDILVMKPRAEYALKLCVTWELNKMSKKKITCISECFYSFIVFMFFILLMIVYDKQ